MAEASLLQQAQEAAKAREYERALELFNQAVDAEPTAEALAGRASVNNKLKNFMEAAADASRAVELDDKLAAAHKEKGHACYALEEFESAQDAFEAASQLEPAKTIHKTWVNMCKVQMGEEPEAPPSRPYQPPTLPSEAPAAAGGGASASGSGGDGKGISLSGQQLQAFLRQAKAGNLAGALGGAGGGGGGVGRPVVEELPMEEEAGSQQPRHAALDDPEFAKYWRGPASAAAAAAASAEKPSGSMYRHQWFQSPDRVEVDVLAKGLKKEQVVVTIGQQRLRVVTTDAEGQQAYDLDLALHAPVVPEQSRFEVLGTKIEIKLLKAVPGRQWAQLEAGAAGDSNGAGGTGVAEAPAAPKPAPAQPTPAYPYAGKKVDWDKFAEEIKKEEKEEKLGGDQELMKFFKQLYDGGDEDTRRAMVKSMQESGGTALSMNWGDVGKKDFSKQGKEGEKDEDFGRPRG